MARIALWRWVIVAVFISAVWFVHETAVQATSPELKGTFEILKDEASTHQPGKVKLVEFADF